MRSGDGKSSAVESDVDLFRRKVILNQLRDFLNEFVIQFAERLGDYGTLFIQMRIGVMIRSGLLELSNQFLSRIEQIVDAATQQ